jgi:hypothetical protein
MGSLQRPRQGFQLGLGLQQVGRGERLVGRHGQLLCAISRADPGSADPHAAAAQGHLAGFAAVPHGGAVGIVAALDADQPGASSAINVCSTWRPVPTARASRPSRRRWQARQQPASPARAAGAGRGRSWPCGGYPSARRSRSGRASWRMPDTYQTAGLRRGPPLQVLRRPAQPRTCSWF